MMPPVVIGAGWSGLACAIGLVRQGHRPIVLDAAPHAGGRARSFDHALGGLERRLDNGQHLMLGAYRDTLGLMQTVGVSPASALVRRPFAITYPDGWQLAAAALPTPWHLAAGLLMARGMSPAERWSLARWSQLQARSGWTIAGDAPAASLFVGAPPALVRRLWRPLCLAALNVELHEASARIFLTVLRDSLGSDARSSELLLPRRELSAIFPDPAVAWLRARGAEVRLGCPVRAVKAGGAGTPHAIGLRDETIHAEHVVLALPGDRAAALLAVSHPGFAPTAALLARVRHAPISTTYLRYAPGTHLARPMLALLDEPTRGVHGQWVFDRGALDASLDGILSVVISGDGPYRELNRDALGESVARQLRNALGLPAPQAHYSVIEKHATVVPEPGLKRPHTRLPVAGFYLAGDSADSPYPSTIEGSVRSGLAAANAIG
jgi:squalene-associated FAD-dependent desaturase